MPTDPGRTEHLSGSAAKPAPVIAFACTGEHWTVGYPEAHFTLKDIKGLRYVRRLLEHPGEEFHALDLINGPGVEVAGDHSVAIAREAGISARGFGDAGEHLDPQAKREYKRRLDELAEQLEDLRLRGSQERAEEVELEIAFLKKEISRAVGIHNRDRRAGSAAERARLNATRAIKSALEKISEHSLPLGRLLEDSISTGYFCSYSMDPAAPIAWQFALGSSQSPDKSTSPVLPRPEPAFSEALRGRTAFVGRDSESQALDHMLAGVGHGGGRMVVVGGAPGVGKTRLTAEFCTKAFREGTVTVAGSCYDREEPVPFLPWLEILERALAEAPTPRAFRDALSHDAPEIARLMPRLTRVLPDIPPAPQVSSEESRRALVIAIVNVIARLAQNQPMVILLEDLHWADEGSLLVLNQMVRSFAQFPLLIIGTYRDNELDPAGPLAQTLDQLSRLHVLERISLPPLPQGAVATMIDDICGRPAPAAVVKFVYSNTEGNAFFVEELVRHLLERGALLDSGGDFRVNLKPDQLDLPDSLRLVVGRRLARLGKETQQVLGVAAIIGKSFTFEPLRATTRLEADHLLDLVEEAEKSGLLFSTLQYPEARFQFSHEIVRQAVLGELSPARRQRIHLRIADAIEQTSGDSFEERANDLAYHLWQAGATADPARTIRFLNLAAGRAKQQGAHEAMLHYSQNALELLARQPETDERARLELGFHLNCGIALMAIRGWAAAATGEAWSRARVLCERFEDDARLFSVLYGLSVFYMTRGEHPKARTTADEMLRLASRLQDDGLLVQAYWTLGSTNFFLGQFVEARESLGKALSLYDPARHRTLAQQFAHDPYMSCLVFEGITLWMLGYADQGEARARAGLALARELGFPFSLSWCIQELTVYYVTRRDFAAAELLIEEGVPFMHEHGHSMLEESELALQLIVTAARGRIDEFIAASRRARKFSAIEFQIRQTWVRSALAEALGKAHKFPTATSLLEQSAKLMESNEERFVEPEIYRIQGELVVDRAGDAAPSELEAKEAEQAFRKAIDSARKRGARMFELRAVIALSHLLEQTGRAGEARRNLSELCATFTEGFDTPEFKSAQKLIQTLSPAQGPASSF